MKERQQKRVTGPIPSVSAFGRDPSAVGHDDAIGIVAQNANDIAVLQSVLEPHVRHPQPPLRINNHTAQMIMCCTIEETEASAVPQLVMKYRCPGFLIKISRCKFEETSLREKVN